MEIRPTGQSDRFELTLTPDERIIVGAAFRERIARDLTEGRLSHTDTEVMSQRLRLSRLFDVHAEFDTTETVDTATIQDVAATVGNFADTTTAVVTDMYNYSGEPRFTNTDAITRLELGCSALALTQEFAEAVPFYDSVDNL